MRVAALYDVHGNLPALEAVLAEVERERVDAVVSGGDVCAGPMPAECLELLRASGALFVRGNADRSLEGWPAGRLTSGQRAFLASLPPTAAVRVEGLGDVLVCHSTPGSDEIYFLETTPDDVAAALLGDVREPVVVCGHTHMQFDRRLGGTRVVNAGSVGLPYEDAPGAYWALFGPGVELRRTEYDLEAAAERVRRSGYPRAEELARDNVLRVPSRAEALAVFEPGVGRPFPYGRASA